MSNADHVILHCDPRWPGSVHDSHAMTASRVQRYCDDGGLNDYFIMGDSGYVSLLKNNLSLPSDKTSNSRHHSCL